MANGGRLAVSKELSQEEIERAALQSMHNMGMPDDMWVDDYGWVFRGGKPTEIGLEWYRREMLGRKDGSTRDSNQRKK